MFASGEAAIASVAFAWSGLPDYAARCLRAFAGGWPSPVHVVATRARVPFADVERSLGLPVRWLEAGDRSARWERLGLAPPDVFFQGGYGFPAFEALGADCRRAGGRVILMADSAWRGTLRQRLFEPLRHRLRLRRRFEAVLVPGAAGRRFHLAMGYPADRIRCGLYGADPALFRPGLPLAVRPRSFLFVGQFVARKHVLGLTDAFRRFVADHPGWTLRLCGSGPERGRIPAHPRILVEEFVQPTPLAELMRQARCLVLPSRREPWGLVVHEAALSGCALALSEAVGAAEDLAGPENAVLFPPGDAAGIERALRAVAAWDTQRWEAAETASRHRAAAFGPAAFAAVTTRLVAEMMMVTQKH